MRFLTVLAHKRLRLRMEMTHREPFLAFLTLTLKSVADTAMLGADKMNRQIEFSGYAAHCVIMGSLMTELAAQSGGQDSYPIINGQHQSLPGHCSDSAD
ncbi:hypothetical protein TcWFU_010303 [Taenia crassiceps]|uniref:Uncharacterized protein n=1 Tax=Taenia crassiceps TaxID=6207 RepID=A0ABR4Q3Q6_9CEST